MLEFAAAAAAQAVAAATPSNTRCHSCGLQVLDKDFVARPTPVNESDYGDRLLLLPGEEATAGRHSFLARPRCFPVC